MEYGPTKTQNGLNPLAFKYKTAVVADVIILIIVIAITSRSTESATSATGLSIQDNVSGRYYIIRFLLQMTGKPNNS